MDNFNSIKVRLELVGGVPPGWSMVHFNSIKVRLERNAFYWCDLAPQFQFHKGAIRTAGVPSIVGGVPPFQFHKGAIRTRKTSKTGRRLSAFQFHKGAIRTTSVVIPVQLEMYFNSIKVRLEPSGEAKTGYPGEFQFHKGAIRTLIRENSSSILSYFNSIKVRLER